MFHYIKLQQDMHVGGKLEFLLNKHLNLAGQELFWILHLLSND